uniref:Toll-like receptor 22 n=1 Tax=Callorhinchus milii TaxID=7868 RepID=A0A4W3KJB0_CALMI
QFTLQHILCWGTMCRVSHLLVLVCVCQYVSQRRGLSFSLSHCQVHGSLWDKTDLKVLCYRMQLVSVPGYIPNNTQDLDLSENRIVSLQGASFQHLQRLQTLNVSKNQIQEVSPGALSSLRNLTLLNLAFNRFSQLSQDTFSGLTSLKILLLHHNYISFIQPTAFLSLTQLQVLNLTSNRLGSLRSAAAALNLPSLEDLHLANNSLANFSTQDIPAVSRTLKMLDVSRNPLSLVNITNGVLSHLRFLNLSFAGTNQTFILQVGEEMFLDGIEGLALGGVLLPLPGILAFLRNLKAVSLKEIQLSYLGLTETHPLVPQICHLLQSLKILDLRRNGFVTLNESFCLNLEMLDLRFNRIAHINSNAFSSLNKLKKLLLSGNKLTTVTPRSFTGLSRLVWLDLGGNSLLEIKNFSESLKNLEILDLQSNKLNSITKNTFINLMSLGELVLGDNQISKLQEGSFQGLSNLTVLSLGSNRLTAGTLRDHVFSGLDSLKVLNLFKNFLSYPSSARLDTPPFRSLKSLQYLHINSQNHNGFQNFPSNFLEGLTSLKEIHCGNIVVSFFDPETFRHVPQLTLLDLSNNPLYSISPGLFQSLPALQELHLKKVNVQNLDFLLKGNLTKLKLLRAVSNSIDIVNQSHIEAMPSLTYLDLRENALFCSCKNSWFQNWSLFDQMTQVIYFDEYTCAYPPNLKGNKLINFDSNSCSADVGFVLYICSFIGIIMTVLCSFVYQFWRWQIVYTYYLFLAFIYEKHKRYNNQTHLYDAFVSYNTHDEQWVLNELLPNLERNNKWKLCLHHRDFEPGKPIIDNIVDSIYKSRKTICVISRHYLESEWCSKEIQVASFKLFDEHNDVLVLVFLEDLPANCLSPYHRMRKLVKKKTYLQWPQHQEEMDLFWHRLGVALKTKFQNVAEWESNGDDWY